MIFRTGSVLIVGMCEDNVLMEIYIFLKKLLKEEFKNICQKVITNDIAISKNKLKKIRKKIINISSELSVEKVNNGYSSVILNGPANKKKRGTSSAIEFEIIN
jgi:hypothetical protein